MVNPWNDAPGSARPLPGTSSEPRRSPPNACGARCFQEPDLSVRSAHADAAPTRFSKLNRTLNRARIADFVQFEIAMADAERIPGGAPFAQMRRLEMAVECRLV